MTRALAPAMLAAGLWRGPEHGCAVALAVLPEEGINVSAAPHPTCVMALVVTAGALRTLPPEELLAAMAHEVAHVRLGHFRAREERRRAGRDPRETVEVTDSPATEAATEERSRADDRSEETAADRFAAALLKRMLPSPGRCQSLVALLERLDRSRTGARWTEWVSSHPSPGHRARVVREECRA